MPKLTIFSAVLIFLSLGCLSSGLSQSLVENSLLSEEEQRAISAAKIIFETDKHTTIKNLKPLLCATFASLTNAQSFDNLIENIKFGGNRCDWIVVPYKPKNGAEKSESTWSTSFKEKIARTASESKSTVTVLDDDKRISSTISNGDELKPLLYHRLLPYLQSYEKLWLLDEDISIEGFNFERYFGIWNCAFHQDSPAPCITQPLMIGKELAPFGNNGWKVFNDSIIAVKSAWIEQQAPILDAQFFSWFTLYFISPLYNEILKAKSDVGHDFTWCGAAKLWNSIKSDAMNSSSMDPNPACAVILGGNPITHKDFQTIHDWHKNTSEWNQRSASLFNSYQAHFPNSYYHAISDTEFTHRQSWYSKSSGECSKVPALRDISPKILLSSRQAYSHLINLAAIPSSAPFARPCALTLYVDNCSSNNFFFNFYDNY
jgi:hypothetical protein